MKLLTATVTKKARLVETKYGPKVVADVTLADGENVTLWQPENSQLINYGNGQKISLTLDSKGKYHFVESTNENAIASRNEPTQGMSKQQKQDIAGYVTEQAKLFGFCLTQASMIEGIQPEDIRPIATTLYLQSVKHFNL